MVGVGPAGTESTLARVSVVNYFGAVLLDEFVRQKERVTDWRTQWSGIRAKDMISGEPCLFLVFGSNLPFHRYSAKTFEEVQSAVAELIKDRILIGHAIQNDLKVCTIIQIASRPITPLSLGTHALTSPGANPRYATSSSSTRAKPLC
jgi:RNA exonuclease 4